MGKALIIKGANFYQNALDRLSGIVWHYLGFSQNYGSEASSEPGGTTYGAWSRTDICAALQGKTINRVRGIPVAAGTYNFYKVSSPPNEVTQLPTRAAYITINPSDVGNLTTFSLSNPITIGQNEYIVMGENGLPYVGDFLFLKMAGQTPANSMYYKVGTNSPSFSRTIYYWLDFGYEE